MALTVSEPTAEVLSTTNATTYALAAFTPTASALLVVFVVCTGKTAAGSVSGGGLTWTRRNGIAFNTTDIVEVFTATAPASPGSTTITYTTAAGGNATGCCLAIVQFAGTNPQVLQSDAEARTGANPVITMPSALSTGNAYAACFGMPRNPPTSTPPTSWTEIADGGVNTPAQGCSAAYRNGGETGTTITFTSLSAAYGIVAVEVYEAPITATLAVTLAAATSSAAGTSPISGATSSTLADATLSATGAKYLKTKEILGSRCLRAYANTYASGTWTDDVSGTNATQATSARQPTAATTTGGNRSLSFDGAGDTNQDYLEGPAIGSLATFNNTGYYLKCFVIKAGALSAENENIIVRESGAGDERTLIDSSGKLFYNNAQSNAAISNDGQYHRAIFVGDAAANNVKLYVDGVLQTTQGNGATSVMGSQWKAATQEIGARNNGTGDYGFAGELAALHYAFSASTFSSQDITDIDDALSRVINGDDPSIHGTLSATLAAATATATGTAPVAGALSKTLDAATSAATATSPIVGATSQTLAAATSSATATSPIAAGLSSTLAAATLSATGTVTDPGTSGTLNATLADATVGATATAPVRGTAGVTLDPATSSSTATSPIRGTAAPTLGAATVVATGTAPVKGQTSAALDPATSLSTATSPIRGATTGTLQDATSSSAGKVLVKGATSSTLGAATLAATGGTGQSVNGTLSVILENATASSAGTSPISGAVSKTLADASLASGGTVRVVGGVQSILTDAALAATASAPALGAVSALLDDVSGASVARAPVTGSLDVTLEDAGGSDLAPITASLAITLENAYVRARAVLPVVSLERPRCRVRFDADV